MMADVRYAIRSLVRARWFTVAAVLTFALGIGLNVAVFSMVDRVLFRPLPYADADRLVLLRECDAQMDCAGGFPSLVAFEAGERLTTLDGIAVTGPTGAYRVSRDAADPALRLHGVSGNLLDVLGVQPILGRGFNAEDVAEKRRVAIVSHEAWMARFAGSRELVGSTIGSGRSTVTIIGILPAGFIPPASGAVDARWDGLVLDTSGWAAIGPSGMIMVPVARLAAGASLEAARAEVEALVAALGPQLRGPQGRPPIIRVDPIQGSLFARFTNHLWLIVGAGVILLLLACANLANLLLARGRSREQAIAIKASLGASPRRLVATAIVESLAICFCGALIAIGTLALTSQALLAIVPPLFARYAAGAADVRVLAAALGAALLCAVVAGMSPAVRVAGVDVLSMLQRGSGTTRATRLRGGRSLLVLEAALGVTLVLSGLVIFRSFTNLAGDALGFRPAGL